MVKDNVVVHIKYNISITYYRFVSPLKTPKTLFFFVGERAQQTFIP